MQVLRIGRAPAATVATWTGGWRMGLAYASSPAKATKTKTIPATQTVIATFRAPLGSVKGLLAIPMHSAATDPSFHPGHFFTCLLKARSTRGFAVECWACQVSNA
jgi:hypothetical protein